MPKIAILLTKASFERGLSDFLLQRFNCLLHFSPAVKEVLMPEKLKFIFCTCKKPKNN
jgi:hypothetical protein